MTEGPEFNYAMMGAEANSWIRGLAQLSDAELELHRIGFEEHARGRGAGVTGTARVIIQLIEKEQARRG